MVQRAISASLLRHWPQFSLNDLARALIASIGFQGEVKQNLVPDFEAVCFDRLHRLDLSRFLVLRGRDGADGQGCSAL